MVRDRKGRVVLLSGEPGDWQNAAHPGLLLYLARKLADERLLMVGTYRAADVTRQHPLDACLRERV